jgi:hypothetical protein
MVILPLSKINDQHHVDDSLADKNLDPKHHSDESLTTPSKKPRIQQEMAFDSLIAMHIDVRNDRDVSIMSPESSHGMTKK